jgi:pimeloyl-ACP methyl ester carboxylesterase
LDPAFIAQELKSFTNTPTFDALVKDLANGAVQKGTSGTSAPVVIGWGRKDRLCLPRQAARAMARFPQAKVHWFESSGHFPMWDQPKETVRMILNATGS